MKIHRRSFLKMFVIGAASPMLPITNPIKEKASKALSAIIEVDEAFLRTSKNPKRVLDNECEVYKKGMELEVKSKGKVITDFERLDYGYVKKKVEQSKFCWVYKIQLIAHVS